MNSSICWIVPASLLLSIPLTSQGQLTQITPLPTPLLSGSVTFTAEDTGIWPITSYQWAVRCTMTGATVSTFTSIPAASNPKNCNLSLTHYDGHEIKCTATYGSKPGEWPPAPPPAPSSVTYSFNVTRPDSSQITSGLGVSTPRDGTKRLLIFTICYTGAMDAKISYSVSVLGWPQESIEWSQPDIEYQGWLPATMNELDPNVYTRLNGNIYDYKFMNYNNAAWSDFNDGEGFAYCIQTNRLVYINCAGTTEHILLSTHALKYKRTSFTTYVIEEL